MTDSEPKQDRSRATRRRILEAAVESLATRGWDGSSVTVVAADAGASRGALQHHFPTREDLTIAALDHMFEQRSEILAAAPVPDAIGRERVRAVLQFVMDLYLSTVFKAALPVWTAAAVDADLRARVAPLERKFGRQVHERVVTLLGVDGSDPHVRDLVEATLDLARGLALADTLTDDSRRRRRVVDTWAPHLASGLGLSPGSE